MDNIYIISSNKSRLNNVYRIYVSNNSFFDFFKEHFSNEPTTQIHFNTTCNDSQRILNLIRNTYASNLILSDDEFDQYKFDNIFDVINLIVQYLLQHKHHFI